VALLKESSATTKELKSAHLLLSVLGKVPELPVQNLKGELTNEPGPAAKGGATVTVMDSDLDAKFVVFGGHLYAALHGDDWNDYGPTSKVYDVTAVLNPETGLANMLDDFIDPRAEARETVRGQQTIRIAGKVTADAVNKVVPQLQASKRMPATVWIQEGGAHQVVQIELEPSKGNTIQMAFSDWNAPVVVEKPPVP
jgi:lipoprotein LprG